MAWPAEVARLHNIHDGCTWSIEKGDLGGKQGYAVGRPGQAVVWHQYWGIGQLRWTIKPTVTLLMVYEAWTFIGWPEQFGTWWDHERKRAIAEAVDLVDDFDEAMRRARRQGSRFIFDLQARRAIKV